MSGRIEVVDLGEAVVKDGTTTCDAKRGEEPFGQLELFQCLGVLAIPYEGAQGIVAVGAANSNGVIIGARDTRTAGMAGNLEPGDTALVSTHPNKSAQFVAKGKKKQAVMVSKGSDGKNMLVVVDGKNDKIQITAFGQLFEMSKKNGITMTDGSNASIQIKDGKIMMCGQVIGGGRTPIGPVAYTVGPTPVAGTNVPATTLPAAGFFVGV